MQAFTTVMISVLILSPYAISWKLLDRRKGNLISRTGKNLARQAFKYLREREDNARYVSFTLKTYSVIGVIIGFSHVQMPAKQDTYGQRPKKEFFRAYLSCPT